VESGACLIQPIPKWTMYANAWSAVSERLHGITREKLDSDGLPPSEVLKRFLDAIGGRDHPFSDEPEFDSHWLSMRRCRRHIHGETKSSVTPKS
jgi:hypothetical protein